MTKFLKSHFFRSSHRGFTLLEMSIVLIIISVVVSGAMVVFAESLAAHQVNETTAKMNAIQNALYDFRLANNRIPCPADVTQPVIPVLGTTDIYFGVEAGNPGSCVGGVPTANFNQVIASVIATTNGSRTVNVSDASQLQIGMGVTGTGIPPGDFIQAVDRGTDTITLNTATGTNVGITLTFPQTAEGMVPTRTLKLPDDYAFDSWGRRIMYTVSKDMTQANAMNIFSATDTMARMTIFNGTGSVGNWGTNTVNAAYVLLSFGPNGHGSYSRNGGATRLNAQSDNTDELRNCNCDSSVNTTGLNGIFVQKDATTNAADRFDNFDDIVVYGTRNDLALQSSQYWNATNANASMACAQANLTCNIVGGIKTCNCNQ